ncbi:general substrate transporter [Aspergillus varians]
MGIKNLPFFGHLTPNLAFTICLCTLSVMNFGMDNTAFNTMQAMDPFIRRFGSYDHKKQKYTISTTHLSYLNSLPRLTFAVGVIAGGFLSQRFGRRPVVFLMLIICLVGVIITYTATTYGQMLAGRMFVQGYVGMEGMLVPMFQAEISPPAIRGAIVVGYFFNHVFGSFIMSCITFKTSQWDTDACWKVPTAVLFIIPSLVLLLAWRLPESPLWLLRKGRDEHALKQLKYLYGVKPGYAAEDDLSAIKATIEAKDASQKGRWADLFRGTNKLTIRKRRLMIVGVVQSLNQLTGQAFATKYGVVFIKTLGTINPYTFNLISDAIALTAPFLIFVMVDRVGRRNLYLFFGVLTGCALLTMGGLGLGEVNFNQKAGIVAMTVIYPFFYCFCFGAMSPLTGSEVPTLSLREKSAVVGWSLQNLWNFVVSFTVPYLLNDDYAGLHSKVGFIFGAICFIGVAWAWFCFPELSRRSLEEIDEMFLAQLPTRKFKDYKSTFASSDPRNREIEAHASDGEDTDVESPREGKGTTTIRAHSVM